MSRSAIAVLGGIAILALGFVAAARPAARQGSPQIDLSHAGGVQNEPSIAVDPGNPNLLVAASQDLSICGLRVYSSSDGGRRWSATSLPVADPAATRRVVGAHRFCAVNEWVAAGRDGRQYVVFLQKQASGWALYLAARQYPQAWSVPTPVDQVPAGSGGDDKPVVAVDDSASSPYDGRVSVAWTRWTTFGVDGSVLLVYSDDQGQTWSAPVTVAPPPGGGWGVHVAVAADGTVYATAWNVRAPGDLWITRSTDGGASFQPLRAFASLKGLTDVGASSVPAEPTQPAQPDPSLAADTSGGRRAGTVYTAYSRPTPKGRRIVVEAFGADLAPELRHTIALRRTHRAYDEFDPAIAVDESNGTVWACFYLSSVREQATLAAYSCVDSHDGGRTWSRVLGGASLPSDETQRLAFNRPGLVDNDYGPYEGLAVSDGVAHPIWTDTRRLARLREEIYTTRVR